jgi:hypothetical protein
MNDAMQLSLANGRSLRNRWWRNTYARRRCGTIGSSVGPVAWCRSGDPVAATGDGVVWVWRRGCGFFVARGRGDSSPHLFTLQLARRQRRTSSAHGTAFDERTGKPVGAWCACRRSKGSSSRPRRRQRRRRLRYSTRPFYPVAGDARSWPGG